MAKKNADTDQVGGFRKESDQTWWIATGLLVGMVLVFVSTHLTPFEPNWLLAIRAFSEAAMIGALADWFAVTALFRYPLGLPIPHTAIIPRNKSRIGRSLGSFVQTNFLSEEVLEGEAVNISGTFVRWLELPQNRTYVVDRFRDILPAMLDTVEAEDVRAFLDQQLQEIIEGIDLAQATGRLLRLLTVDNMHEVFLDEVVRQAQGFFRSNQDWFRAQLREASPWFVPEFVDRRIFEAILSKTEDTLSQALTNRDHELRRRFHAAVEKFIAKLESSEESRKKGEELRSLLLSNEIFRGYLASLRDGVLEGLRSDLREADSHIATCINRILFNFVVTMNSSPELQQKLNRTLRSFLRSAAGGPEGHVASLISRTIDSWDASTIVRKLEQEVGPDLQYIRINGTLVGGGVGILLFLFKLFVVG